MKLFEKKTKKLKSFFLLKYGFVRSNFLQNLHFRCPTLTKNLEWYLVQAVGFLELGTAETLLRQQWEKERDPKASKHIVKAAAFIYHWGTLVWCAHHKIIKINLNKKLVVWIQVILFEIDCAIFYTNLHEWFCQCISWTNWVNFGKFMDNFR